VCLARELKKPGLKAETQVPLPVVYEGEKLVVGYRIDLLVEGLVLVEIKCVEAIHPVHQAQLCRICDWAGRHVGLLIDLRGAPEGRHYPQGGRVWLGAIEKQ